MTHMLIHSCRLSITELQTADIEDLFFCISPSVTTFLPWDPPVSIDELNSRHREFLSLAKEDDFWFVVRLKETGECLGSASLNAAASSTPEIGVWLKEAVHGLGFGGETIKRLMDWTAALYNPAVFIYPVATDNTASRRIAERLGGMVKAQRRAQKYKSVVYSIPRPS